MTSARVEIHVQRRCNFCLHWFEFYPSVNWQVLITSAFSPKVRLFLQLGQRPGIRFNFKTSYLFLSQMQLKRFSFYKDPHGPNF